MDNALTLLAARVELAAATIPFVSITGEVSAASAAGLRVEGLSPWLRLGAMVTVHHCGERLLAEVIRLERGHASVKLLGSDVMVGLGARVSPAGPVEIHPHDSWKGRLVDALGRPADDQGPLPKGPHAVRLDGRIPSAMAREKISAPVRTGVRVLDIFTPLCFGQRIGVFAGSGVGKSTLLSMLARSDAFDTIVVALVGERGREVREFVDVTLGGLAGRAITVVSTGNESAMMRRLAPQLATAIAEHFRDLGQKVLLIMDSVTRYAHAARDVALAAGEPPVARGYPPSVFSELPKLLERAGPGSNGTGSITGIYAVLVDGDDHNDPVADAIRGTLDGHIVLDRAIAEYGRYPAVDILASISRLAHQAWTPDQRNAVAELRRLITRYEETRDLRSVGGLQAGADEELDRAVAIVPKLYRALTQSLDSGPSQDAFRDIAGCLRK